MLKGDQINICTFLGMLVLFSIFIYGDVESRMLFMINSIVTLISTHRVLKNDYENGIIEQIFLYKNIYIEITKITFYHWLKNGLMLSTVSFFLNNINIISFSLIFIKLEYYIILLYTSLMITFIGILGESATVDEKTNVKGIIISFPLIIPTLISSVLMMEKSMQLMIYIVFFINSIITVSISVMLSAINIKSAIQYK